jgi:hypothetical protein
MCIPLKEHCFDINGEPVAGETRDSYTGRVSRRYVFGEYKGLCTVSCNEQFNTQTTNIHCSIQQGLVDFTGVNEGQGLWKLRVMWNLTQEYYTIFIMR